MARPELFLRALVWLSFVLGTLAINTRFEQFYPQYGSYFSNIRDTYCASEYSNQQANYKNKTDITGPCPQLFDCILQHTSEEVKGNMASATVLLGLMPTILIFLSSSMTETALLARRRPLLAFLLACGSPAVDPIPSFVYPNPTEYLRPSQRSLLVGSSRLKFIYRAHIAPLVMVGEYLLALGAVAIAVFAAYDAGRRSISAVACTDDYYPQLWLAFNAMVHILSVIALYLQAEVVPQERGQYDSTVTKISRLVCCELRLCLLQDKMELRLKEETLSLIIFWWFRSLAVVAYFAYGTVAFSSLGFIGEFGYIQSLKLASVPPICHRKTKASGTGYNDAIRILAQFMGSALICRIVLMFELAGMRIASSHIDSLYPEDNGAELALNPTFNELREEGQPEREAVVDMPSIAFGPGLGRTSVNFHGRS